MGYSTDFSGSFNLDKPLKAEHQLYLEKFNETRRMKRNPALLPTDPIRLAAGLTTAGVDGGYFVSAGGSYGQEHGPSVVDYNDAPRDQPGLWCQWRPSEDGESIHWDGGEKFYNYVEWLEYLVKHFLGPWGYKLNGSVNWSGEDTMDVGVITVTNNVVVARSTQEEIADEQQRAAKFENALREILKLQKNPVRRKQYAGNPDYKAPDWIQTKDLIFEIASEALK